MPKPFWPHLSVGLVLALAQPGYAQESQKEVRDSAIRAIRKLGGRVVQNTDDPKKAWVEVELSGNPNRITDETIQKIRDHLRNLGTINKLDLGYAKITDDGLKHSVFISIQPLIIEKIKTGFPSVITQEM